jgi:hypothetical protein
MSWDVETAQTGPYGPPTNVSYQLSSNNTGDKAAHTLKFDIKAGDLETYQAVITFPEQFIFNGFLALGPAGTQIGSYSVDFDFDDVVDFTIPVYAIDNNNAYADRDLNVSFNASVDSSLVYSDKAENKLTTTLPFGGDGSQQTITGPFTERVVAFINPGILTNPQSPGTYTVSSLFISVDPDNDGPDNNSGEPPQTLNITRDIVITSTFANNPPSAPELVFPSDGQTGLETTVMFQWNRSTDPDGDNITYDLTYCEEQAFSGCMPVDIALTYKNVFYAASYEAGLLLFGVLIAGAAGNRGRYLILISAVIITIMLFISCGNGKGSDNGDAPVTGDISYAVSGLKQEATYYWKVTSDDGNGGTADSDIRSFTIR